MGKFVSGCIAGSLLTIIALTLFAGLLHSRAERHLIDDWRKIQPGMNKESVLQTLGDPAYDMKLGDGFPAWAEKSVPDDYYKTHALLVFYVPGPGPQLLLVYLDGNGGVSFVSSTST
jgi:hypothetical protein